MELFLMKKIETLRNQMVQEASDQGQLTSKKVVTLSQKLDRYIIIYQRLKKQASNVIEQPRYSTNYEIINRGISKSFIDLNLYDHNSKTHAPPYLITHKQLAEKAADVLNSR